jgi:hypothetical protein
MNTNGKKTINVGTKVTYRGSWGRGPIKKATIKGIELCDCENAKYGTPVSEVAVEDIRRCIFDLNDGHWAYGDQIVEILQNTNTTEKKIITKTDIENELEKFISENPYADTFDIALHFTTWGQEQMLNK